MTHDRSKEQHVARLHVPADQVVAVAELREGIRIDPGLAEAHRILGYALGQKGDFSGSVEAYRRATSLAPGNPALERELAEAERMAGQSAK